MLFSSYEFIFVFLPVVFVVYFWLNRRRLVVAGKTWLVLSSLFFYAWWNPADLPLIVGSILVNFTLGREIARYRGGQPRDGWKGGGYLLFVGVLLNLSLLGYFKYADFFLSNLNVVFGTGVELPRIVLPLGISFFTFTQIAYLVDCYREDPREYDFLNYCLFVTFFPHLIAGPILHHKEMMPQFASRSNLVRRDRNIAVGLFVFSVGLFKKVAIADTFARWVGPGFESAVPLKFFEAWVTSLSYTFQLYFDFSGYTDMAIGAALLFNIRLPANFDSPYKATNIRSFWRRWHMSLSRFLRDYIYVPLGGSRQNVARIHANLFATFLLGGLWHGASWMFVIWGALHGLAVMLNHAWSRTGFRMPAWLGWLLTFNFVNVAWVFFRAHDMNAAANVLKGMAGLQGIVLPGSLAGRFAGLDAAGVEFGVWMNPDHWDVFVVLALLAAFWVVTCLRNSSELYSGNRPVRALTSAWAVAHALAFVVAVFMVILTEDVNFLYFNF